VCALFPIVRVLYGRLRNRIIRMMVQDFTPIRAQAARQRQQQRGVQQGIQEQQRRANLQERLERLEIQLRARQRRVGQQLEEQLQQLPVGPGAGRRFHFQVGELFGFEIAHFVFDRPPAVGEPVGPGPGPGIARAGAVVGDAANGGDERAEDNPADRQQQPHQDGPVQEPERDPPALAPADQDPQQQQQPPPEPEQQQRAEPEQGQAAPDEDDVAAVAERVIRATGASLGRIVGGALLMPSIARMMGSVLLHISHVVPLIRTIIAPLPPPLLPGLPSLPPSGPISTLVSLIRGARAGTLQVGYHGDGHGWLSGSGLGAVVLRGLFATSQEWATSDPVWYVFFPVSVSQFIHPPMFFPRYIGGEILSDLVFSLWSV